ncbi:hypothetical protein DAI22_09g070000 [Oryza sativa Japonica Group]|uniref:Uncharacterized protein n=1 Tax=Oryza sativa subsp. japonica TaxID=39947 RepID=Q6K2I0_ORYSJ|nr:hypothetical protein DAI22_09g070000 [Oryza sativa Japonica Group]BAD23309.1 hypothetical protein [Oryza sativa Japonica Group]BAD23636.1 hypothetical protein [Oryza sativa Japonica Group]
MSCSVESAEADGFGSERAGRGVDVASSLRVATAAGCSLLPRHGASETQANIGAPAFRLAATKPRCGVCSDDYVQI